jgi:hypothetical protein
MRDPSPVVTLALRGRRVSDRRVDPRACTDAMNEYPWIDRQGIALVIVVTVLALVLIASALWIGLRPI